MFTNQSRPSRSGGFNKPSNNRSNSSNSFGGNSNRGGYQGSNRSGFGGGGNRNRFGGGNRSRGGGGGRNMGAYISPDKYISKVITVEEAEKPVYQAVNTFADFNISERVKENVANKGYTVPTEIQDRSIPEIILGKDLIGLANTGSGKTAAFLLPLISKVDVKRGETVLIIVPTRELAQQIDTEFRQFAAGMKIYSTIVIGGASMGKQISELRRNPHFVIGTPGRLMDLEKRGIINFAHFHNIVLDEVDRMLDMGFIADIKSIINKLPVEKQTLFFSATMSSKTLEIANALLRNPVKVEIKNHESSKNIIQDIVKVEMGKNKVELLHDILVTEETDKVLIFSRTKWESEKLSKALFALGHKVGAIHGNKSQKQRERIILSFRESKINVLVGTDVVARGIDVPNISHVINYDEPATYEDYVHRIGRTGRAGKTGKALTFVDAKKIR